MAEQKKTKGIKPRKYTPETLATKFDEYVKYINEHPLWKQVATKGGIVDIDVKQPLTLVGFCVFADITMQTFINYESQETYFEVTARVRERVAADQIAGAMAGLYDSSIVSRVQRLADRQDITTDGKAIQSQPTVIHLIYNNEEFDITASDVE